MRKAKSYAHCIDIKNRFHSSILTVISAIFYYINVYQLTIIWEYQGVGKMTW